MYEDLKVILKIGKIEKTMSQTVGVRQGDYIAADKSKANQVLARLFIVSILHPVRW